ncbi:enoyl-CoA delta isomerase 2-like [Pseudoliparis swirei]|uniref:enoyl-CoA delta isomerase 2-like n=1 Tax=Pseudoliparis swirei TaxID=2059687 RepID=UPI0024BE7A3A|nr:enoyl-CoA delta isomerase 2-like [Pseudoliparis swirei]
MLSSVPGLKFHTSASPLMGATVEQFERAKSRLSSLKEDPGNEAKLRIYALFKQATQGPCNTPKPGMLDFVNKVKWEAWRSLGSVSQDEARQQYCDLIGSLAAAEGESSAPVAAQPAGSGPTYETLLVTTEDAITTITLNRPAKKNALTTAMYDDIIAALDQAAKDDSVITVFTGAGDFYCSGNDLSNFTSVPEGGLEESARRGGELLR